MSTYSDKLKSPTWQKRRLTILNRDSFKCKWCGDDKSTLHIHHLGYGQDPLTVEDKLLITLCEKCHEEETNTLNKIRIRLFNDLRNLGMNSIMIEGMYRIFGEFREIKDRDWQTYEPSYDIINYFINDDELWELATERFWDRLNSKNNI
jgi:hypothetical protein